LAVAGKHESVLEVLCELGVERVARAVKGPGLYVGIPATFWVPAVHVADPISHTAGTAGTTAAAATLRGFTGPRVETVVGFALIAAWVGITPAGRCAAIAAVPFAVLVVVLRVAPAIAHFVFRSRTERGLWDPVGIIVGIARAITIVVTPGLAEEVDAVGAVITVAVPDPVEVCWFKAVAVAVFVVVDVLTGAVSRVVGRKVPATTLHPALGVTHAIADGIFRAPWSTDRAAERMIFAGRRIEAVVVTRADRVAGDLNRPTTGIGRVAAG
jgi:hypothetical protein